jgi:SAM-dependent methyltransferase
MTGREDGFVADRYEGFPDGFFARADDLPDPAFYATPRLVTHLDAAAIAAVGDVYDELGLTGEILDLCSSWISHFRTAPTRLVALGMNAVELDHNAQAREWLIQDLNLDPSLPFSDASFDGATCCVSVDYLVRPLEVFDEVARVLRPGGPFVCTFSNRCFPTKAIRGWLSGDDDTHLGVVSEYFRRSHDWADVVAERRTPAGHHGDPLYAVWARRATPPPADRQP